MRVTCKKCHFPSDPILGPSDSCSHREGCENIGNDPRHNEWLENSSKPPSIRSNGGTCPNTLCTLAAGHPGDCDEDSPAPKLHHPTAGVRPRRSLGDIYPEARRQIQRESKAWCGFVRKDYSQSDEEQHFHADIMMEFKPVGLMLFGVKLGMTVQCYISTREQLDVAFYGTLPAMVFSRAQSYEQLQKMIMETEANINEWADFETVHVGQIIRVVLKAPRPHMLTEVQVAMWGLKTAF